MDPILRHGDDQNQSAMLSRFGSELPLVCRSSVVMQWHSLSGRWHHRQLGEGPSLLFEAQRVNETVRVVGGSRDCELYRPELTVRQEAQLGISKSTLWRRP
jgi:hypothetical protein